MKLRQLLVAIGVQGFVFTGCAAQKDQDPLPIRYTLAFPSTAAAVAVQGVKVFVYEGEPDSCVSILQRYVTNQGLPAPTIESPQLTPCEMLLGNQDEFNLPFGQYTALAVGVNQEGKNLLAGCTTFNVDGQTQLLDLVLTPIEKEQSVPATACMTLSQKCKGECK